MGGKASILIILGFSAIFLVVGQNFNNLSVNSVDNFSKYYGKTVAHNIAVSGANMAASQIFFSNEWSTGFSNVPFSGGMLTTVVEVIDSFQNIKKLTTYSRYTGYNEVYLDTVSVTFQPSKFSRFAYYSAYEPSNIWWTTGDTVWGPMHVQGQLWVNASPVFFGKVTTENGLYTQGYYQTVEVGGHWETEWVKKKGKWVQEAIWVPEYQQVWVSTADPKFYGGYEQGVDLDLPVNGVSNVQTAALAGGRTFSSKDTVYLTFAQDSLRYRFSKNKKDTTVLGSTFAPNGVIMANNSVLRVKGKVKGQYTIGVSGTSSKGKVFIDDDLIYNSDPRQNPNSQDLLGMVAQNDIMITDNTANNNNINIHASMYSQEGGFGSENYSTRPPSGSINLLGGIIQSTRRAVGTFSGSYINHGFNKKYRYDDRLMVASPPSFPGTGSFEIVSWYE